MCPDFSFLAKVWKELLYTCSPTHGFSIRGLQPHSIRAENSCLGGEKAKAFSVYGFLNIARIIWRDCLHMPQAEMDLKYKVANPSIN